MSQSEQAHRLVLRFGRNPTAYQILNRGFRHWLAPSGDAVVGFVEAGSTWVVAGEPICPPGALGRHARRFEEVAAQLRRRVCYVGAKDELRAALGQGHSAVTVGADPICNPQLWPASLKEHPSLRAQLNRSRNKGVSAIRWQPDHAMADRRLRDCLLDWLAARGLPPLHFMVEPDTLGNLEDRDVYVALRDSQVVGFLIASPVPATGGWLIEQLVRRPDAPNGTAELLMDTAMHSFAIHGVAEVSLGTAPLSSRCRTATGPWWLEAALSWQRAHARRFYNFAGLEAFKAKFRPARWDPVYLITHGRPISPGILWDVVAAYCNGSPLRTLAGGLVSAVKQEVNRLIGRV